MLRIRAVSFHADVSGAEDARSGARRFSEAVVSGEAQTLLSGDLKTTVQVTIAKPPVFEKLSFHDQHFYGGIVTADDLDSTVANVLIAVLVIAYLLLAVMLAWSGASLSEEAHRPPCLVFILWLLFGFLVSP